MLEIFCVDVDPAAERETWKLAFDMRSGGATKADAPASSSAADTAPHPRIDDARAQIQSAFRTGAGLATLVRDLEAMFETRAAMNGRSRPRARCSMRCSTSPPSANAPPITSSAGSTSPASCCGRAPVRRSTRGAAARCGACSTRTSRSPRASPAKLAWWIVWRRIAGGLAKGQQEQIYDRLAQYLLPSPKQAKKVAEIKASKQELAEIWRVVASLLERLPIGHKQRLGDELMRRMDTRKGREDAVHLWALSRVGARVPMYGPLNAVVQPSKVGQWLAQLVAWDWPEPDKLAFPLAQLGRRTGDRSRDLDDTVRTTLATTLHGLPGGERAAVLVEQVVALEAREELVALGDTLPAGLRLIADDDRAPDAPTTIARPTHPPNHNVAGSASRRAHIALEASA